MNFPVNLDSNDALQEEIKSFYEINCWDKIRGDDITDQNIAESIFDFAVNAGTITSAKLAQITVDREPDGTIGQETLQRLNAQDARTFLALFSLHKIARHINICEKRADSKKFFFALGETHLGGTLIMADFLSDLFSSGATSLVTAVGHALDKVTTSDEERKELDNGLAKASMQHDAEMAAIGCR